MATEEQLRTDDDKLFENIDGEQRITEIESYCMNCGENVILNCDQIGRWN